MMTEKSVTPENEEPFRGIDYQVVFGFRQITSV